MTAMPQSGSNGGRRGRESGGGNLAVVFERLDTNERAIDTVTTQVSQLAAQVSALAGTAQVLANTDGAFKQQQDAQSTQIAAVQSKLFEIVQQLGDIRASIKQAVTDALREAQGVERRADDGRAIDARQIQQWLITALIAVLGAVLTYLFTHPIH